MEVIKRGIGDIFVALRMMKEMSSAEHDQRGERLFKTLTFLVGGTLHYICREREEGFIKSIV